MCIIVQDRENAITAHRRFVIEFFVKRVSDIIFFVRSSRDQEVLATIMIKSKRDIKSSAKRVPTALRKRKNNFTFLSTRRIQPYKTILSRWDAHYGLNRTKKKKIYVYFYLLWYDTNDIRNCFFLRYFYANVRTVFLFTVHTRGKCNICSLRNPRVSV